MGHGEGLERAVNSAENREKGQAGHPEKLKGDFPTLTLHFMRHSKKGKLPEGVTNDNLTPLSAEGRELAAKKFAEPTNMRFAHIEGSPRERTLQTGAIAATGDANTNPEDLGIGKTRIDDRLNFTEEGDGEYVTRFNDAYAKKAVLSFLVHESDALAKKTGDTQTGTYSRYAANIASIIEENYRAVMRGSEILEQSENPENNLSNNFERMMATHATISECFLLKAVEKTEGAAERDALMETIGGGAFSETEGFDTTFSKVDGKVEVRVTYKKGGRSFDTVVPESVLQEIIKEGE